VRDADGSFSFRVPPGRQHVYFQDFVPDGYLRPPVEGREPEVAEGGRAEVTIELPRDPNPPLAGRVLAADGRPVTGAWVTAEGPRESEKVAKTSESGRFKFAAVAPGSRVRVRYDRLETVEAVEVKGGEDNLTLRLRDDARASLLVRVTDGDGKPVPGAKVQLVVVSPGGFGLGSTDPAWSPTPGASTSWRTCRPTGGTRYGSRRRDSASATARWIR